ncbi:NAD(P)-dependent dehydrogenase (short-subunit alcohol dehydrogenase family) [Sphingobium xenophagum]|uniref:NAD(P)-dependent dehydrogenase (Short-subunit alcohol dehydrogenase family) n=1 Tax=Sphingobium xenophagum TaxID=121428 RepID=A0ABU1X4E6_SPHXE|nr:SDR family NAD(P)-dependent oxidoreductase [Sphingobium xenophagum]MDR7156465.1 NAD(P)-dependent dehydrogenase (short-subunit alcohol dehydrogenase family) [Sphingobium xenophagum]
MADKVIITGAAGGMGRACARLFGNAHDLVLTDRPSPALDSLVQELDDDGYRYDLCSGDVTNSDLSGSIMERVSAGERFTLIHAAGLGPSHADWRTIIQVNLIAVEQMARAASVRASAGSVAILIASTAGYMMPAMSGVDKLIQNPMAAGFLNNVAPVVEQMCQHGGAVTDSAIAYVISKYGVQKLAERYAA